MPDDQTQRTPPVRRSPLASVWIPGDHGRTGSGGPGVTLHQGRDLSILRLQYAAAEAAKMAAYLSEKLGVASPAPNRAAEADGVRVLWGGPKHLTLIAPDGTKLLDRVADVTERTGGTFVDQSHGHAILRIAGPRARDLLSKGTGIDLHPDIFVADHVAHTALFHHTVTFDRREGPSTYDVHMMRGFAQDLFEHLTAHAAEYGYRLA
ncbi:MAG: hypothetical protein NXI19_20725 [Alphaproteobacteria bacterium]|jgi:sarcosine oxidase subunit gamma|nr:hypothetical protein [Alphaproteobacteria bacterium]